MSDDDLEALRAQRLQQLQKQYGRAEDAPSKEQQESAHRQQQDMRNAILTQVLDQQARARLNTLALAKPEKAKMVENLLIQMAQTGQIQAKLGETQLKGLLERVSEQTQKKTTVTFDRKRAGLDDDD